MEFNTEVILVEGIVQETITGEKACPSCLPCLKEGLCAPCPMGCAQPRIFLTDIVEPQFPRLMVLLREGDEVYKEGQRVMVTGRVDAGPAAVVVHKIYE